MLWVVGRGGWTLCVAAGLVGFGFSDMVVWLILVGFCW